MNHFYLWIIIFFTKGGLYTIPVEVSQPPGICTRATQSRMGLRPSPNSYMTGSLSASRPPVQDGAKDQDVQDGPRLRLCYWRYGAKGGKFKPAWT